MVSLGFLHSLRRLAVIFILAAGRSHDVPEEHLVEGSGIMVVDRYKAYQAVDKVKSGLIRVLAGGTRLSGDGAELAGIKKPGPWAGWNGSANCTDSMINVSRCAMTRPLSRRPTAALRGCDGLWGTRRGGVPAPPDLHPAPAEVLKSLGNHWTGLTVFVEHPEVPMDNSTAERSERGPVVGRKNYYGSGSLWSRHWRR